MFYFHLSPALIFPHQAAGVTLSPNCHLREAWGGVWWWCVCVFVSLAGEKADFKRVSEVVKKEKRKQLNKRV